jgi:hypothetical protein
MFLRGVDNSLFTGSSTSYNDFETEFKDMLKQKTCKELDCAEFYDNYKKQMLINEGINKLPQEGGLGGYLRLLAASIIALAIPIKTVDAYSTSNVVVGTLTNAIGDNTFHEMNSRQDSNNLLVAAFSQACEFPRALDSKTIWNRGSDQLDFTSKQAERNTRLAPGEYYDPNKASNFVNDRYLLPTPIDKGYLWDSKLDNNGMQKLLTDMFVEETPSGLMATAAIEVTNRGTQTSLYNVVGNENGICAIDFSKLTSTSWLGNTYESNKVAVACMEGVLTPDEIQRLGNYVKVVKPGENIFDVLGINGHIHGYTPVHKSQPNAMTAEAFRPQNFQALLREITQYTKGEMPADVKTARILQTPLGGSKRRHNRKSKSKKSRKSKRSRKSRRTRKNKKYFKKRN